MKASNMALAVMKHCSGSLVVCCIAPGSWFVKVEEYPEMCGNGDTFEAAAKQFRSKFLAKLGLEYDEYEELLR